MKPKISVVLPVWNGANFVGAAIDSILAQTFADFELVVVDDGSDDGTADILRSYTDSRLKVYSVPHGGIVTALNLGINRSSAALIARQDADDLSRPDRLRRQWDALQREPRAVLCFTDHSLLNETAAEAGAARLPRSRSFIALRLCYQCPFAHGSVLFAKEAFLAAGGYVADERHAEDYALWGRMLELGDFVGLPEPLIEFRIHASSVSRQNLEAQEALTLKIASENCGRFMGLDELDAQRAATLLRTPTRERKIGDWLWFLLSCAPELRWKSAETFGWLAWQTAKRLVPLSGVQAKARRAA